MNGVLIFDFEFSIKKLVTKYLSICWLSANTKYAVNYEFCPEFHVTKVSAPINPTLAPSSDINVGSGGDTSILDTLQSGAGRFLGGVVDMLVPSAYGDEYTGGGGSQATQADNSMHLFDRAVNAYDALGSLIGNDSSHYLVAQNANLPKEQGGALGRTDILSTLTGKHECVALLQEYGAPSTKNWIAGPQVTKNMVLEQNTMIATFVKDANGNLVYPRGNSGQHAALWDAAAGGFDDRGLHVIQQYEIGARAGEVHQAIIKDMVNNIGNRLGKDASNYYVVTQKKY